MNLKDLTPKEYHRIRDEIRYQERESLRLQRLEMIKAAICKIAPQYKEIEEVYLFGSILLPGHHGQASDIDVAVHCSDVAVESRFWFDLEHAVRWNVDVRPYHEPLISEISLKGEKVYGREDVDPSKEH